jgi:hypothetical protein
MAPEDCAADGDRDGGGGADLLVGWGIRDGRRARTRSDEEAAT